MTKKPKKKTAKAARKVLVKAKPKAKAKAAKVVAKLHPLDAYIVSAAKALELKIDPAWMPSVRANLDVSLKMGALVASFPLDDEAEPAPVYGA